MGNEKSKESRPTVKGRKQRAARRNVDDNEFYQMVVDRNKREMERF
jgi:hypothetical protein